MADANPARGPAKEYDLPFLQGGGELGARIRAYDWAHNPLGPPETWPQSLRSAVSILLPSKAQIALFWGPDLITLYNDAYRPVFGAKHPSALGLPIRESWNELWVAGLKELFDGVLQEGEAFWAQDRPFMMERHGYLEETFFDVSYDPVRDESGQVGGVFCIVSETTGRVVGERRLKTLRDLAARDGAVPQLGAVCNAAAESLAANPHDLPFALLFLAHPDGQPPTACLGTPGAEALGDPSRWPWEAVLADRQLRLVDLTGWQALPTGAWSSPPTQAALVPLEGAGQTGCSGVLVAALNPHRAFDADYRTFVELAARQIASSIADARAYEQERERTRQLEELDRAKTAFFSNVSHEFRTPLTLMLGPLDEALQRPEGLPPEVRAEIQVAQRNAQRLLKLVNTLLDFSRLEAGRIQSTYQPVDLAGFTAELASLFRSAIERAGLQLVVDCPPLPEPVWVDREMWEKIVFNLLSNAFKFTFEGSIAVSVRPAGEAVELAVRDTGTGIPAGDLPHVFERFHRVRGARGRTFEGSGIGLALVKELVRLHGGSVGVESTPGRGTCFTVTLPLGKAHLPADRVAAAAPPASGQPGARPWVQEVLSWLPNAPPGGDGSAGPRSALDRATGRAFEPVTAPARILLADDNADMREYVRRLLSDTWQVEAVGDGAAALRAARDNPPDLVITDVMMPELDGFGLLKALRASDRLRFVPVMMLSARAGEEARIEGLGAGADDYLVKPFSARELRTRVASRLELARLQDHLRQGRAELAKLFAQTPVPTAVLRGPDLVFEMINAAYVAVIGRDVTGLPLRDALPGAEAQGFGELLRNVIRTGEAYVGRELPMWIDRQGRPEQTFWTFVYAPFGGAEPGDEGVIAICNDVTAEVNARELIRKSETRYRNIFETAAVAIFEEDFSQVKRALDELRASGVGDLEPYLRSHPQFVREAIGLVRIIDANGAAVRMFGAPGKEALLESLHRIFTPDTHDVFVEELIAVAEARPQLDAETRLHTLRGEPIDVLFSIVFSTADPELRSVLVTVTDISERKRAEQALRAEALTLERLNRVGRALTAELELERIVQTVTDAATELCGAAFGAFFYNVERTEGESYLLYTLSGAPREAFARFGMPRNTDLFRHTFLGRGPVRADDVTQDPRYGKTPPHYGMPEGHLPVRSYLAVPVISRSGEVLGGLFLGHPEPGVFTERAEQLLIGLAAHAAVAIDNARLQEQRLQLIERLREDDRRKDEFLATLAHELRNPLAPLRNSLHLMSLAGGGGSAPALREIMQRQISHLVRLVDDLLEMSRISRGTFELRKERIQLAAVIRNAIEAADPLIQQAGHQLALELAEQPMWVDGDPVRLAQILANLLNNAAKYTEPGGRIALAERRERGMAVVSVRDNGSGISGEALPHVFEMFNRGDRHGGGDAGGLGIGLALAQRLAQMHGGGVTAHSEGPGRGSEFVLRLPLAAEQDLAVGSESAPQPAVTRRKILLVDDNRDAAETMSMLLEFLGADVRVAFDGEQALDVFGPYDPAVVLLDIGLPTIDGYEVARRMRAQYPSRRVAIVALTGWGQEEHRRRAREAGFDHHLVKPVDIGALQTILSSLEERRA